MDAFCALVLALGQCGLARFFLTRAVNPRPETGPGSGRPGKARAGPRAFWIFSCFLKEFQMSQI